jgi:hypothetical protein
MQINGIRLDVKWSVTCDYGSLRGRRRQGRRDDSCELPGPLFVFCSTVRDFAAGLAAERLTEHVRRSGFIIMRAATMSRS